MLEHLLARLGQVPELEKIVVATSDMPQDDPIEDLANRLGVPCYRGSLDNVLERVALAARQFDIRTLVRVTGDSLFVEPKYIGALVRLHAQSKAEYSSAKDPEKFPRGTTAEVVNTATLEKILSGATAPEDLEHVTWHIRRNSSLYRMAFLQPDPRLKIIRDPQLRLAIDEARDFELAERLFERLYPENPLFGLAEILELYRSDKELFRWNAAVESTTKYPELEVLRK